MGPRTGPKVSIADLTGVAETLILPLAFRADESSRPDAILRDPKAVELTSRIDYDFERWVQVANHDRVTVLLRMREFDRGAEAFLNEHPDGIVTEIGCGLDTRFYRTDNGRAEWYELDLPHVMAVRSKLLDPNPRVHFIACSALDLRWLDAIPQERPHLFLAEGVLVFFTEEEVKRLICALRTRFPGAQLMLDAFTSFMIRISPLLHPTLRKKEVRLKWGLRDSRELEQWGEGIHLLSEWLYFDQPEPRLGPQRLFRWIPWLAQSAKILRYQLGDA